MGLPARTELKFPPPPVLNRERKEFQFHAISVSPTLPLPPSISLWRPARGGGCVAFVHHHSRHRRHSCWFLADFNRHLRSLDVNDRQRGSKKKWKKVSKNQLLVEFALVKCKLLFQMHWDWKVIVSDNWDWKVTVSDNWDWKVIVSDNWQCLRKGP